MKEKEKNRFLINLKKKYIYKINDYKNKIERYRNICVYLSIM